MSNFILTKLLVLNKDKRFNKFLPIMWISKVTNYFTFC